MGNALRDKTVVIVGRGAGIARAVALLARSEGARVIAAGRNPAKLASAYGSDITAEAVDITDDGSIETLADRVGAVDHVVSTASARARGKLGELDRQKLQLSFDTKVIGPTMLAKYFAPQINPGGSFVLFSGVHAFKLMSAIWGWASPMVPSTSSPAGWPSNSRPHGSTRFLPELSIPERGTRSATTASGIISSTSPTATRRGESEPWTTLPAPCCSR